MDQASTALLLAAVVAKVLPIGFLLSCLASISPYLLLIILMTSGWSQLGIR